MANRVFQTYNSPFPGGISVAPCVYKVPITSGGTYSCPVIYNGQRSMLLSWHVGTDIQKKLQPNLDVCQPLFGRAIATVLNDSRALPVSTFDTAINIIQGRYIRNTTEAVIAQPKLGNTLDSSIIGIGSLSGWTYVKEGMKVRWDGVLNAGTGTIMDESINTIPMPEPGIPSVDPFSIASSIFVFDDLFSVRVDSGDLSHGDSGAVVVEENTNRAVGLILSEKIDIIPGTRKIAICQKMSNIVSKLGIDLVVGPISPQSITPSPLVTPVPLIAQRTYWFSPIVPQRTVIWFGRQPIFT